MSTPSPGREAPCVAFYRTIRSGVPAESLQIGHGYNRCPPSLAVADQIRALMDALLEGDRLREYSSHEDANERALLAALLNRYLGTARFDPDDIVFTTGATEGISLTCAHAAAQKLAAILPLPCYYAFEQSSRRYGLPVASYYSSARAGLTAAGGGRRVLEVLVIPNGVTGSVFPEPDLHGAEPGLTLIDCVFHAGARTPGLVRAAVTEAYRRRRHETTALLLTASKDLSLPGLRAGALCTGSDELLAHARADRFDRTFSSSPLASRTLLAYMCIVLLHAGEPPEAIAEEAGAHGFPEVYPAALAATIGHLDRMAALFEANLKTAIQFPLSIPDDWHHQAGYSALAVVDEPEFADAGSFSHWIHNAGVAHRLKLNPNFLFGGGPCEWNALYPGRYCIRLNLSVTEPELVETLDCFAKLSAAP